MRGGYLLGPLLLAPVLLRGRLAGVDDHVAHAQLLDPGQDLAAGALAGGDHRDHRSDSEHDAQGREQRAQLVPRQIAQRLDQEFAEDHAKASGGPSAWIWPS